MKSSNSTNSSTPKISFPTDVLFLLIAIGLCAQISLVFWPIGNYATLVYILFYLPLIILFFINNSIFIQLFRKSDKVLLVSLLLLLIWVTITSLWADSTNDDSNLFIKTLKHNTLIIFYVIGVGLVCKYKPNYLTACLIASTFLAALIACISIVNQYYFQDYPLTYRLASFGLGDRENVSNSVVIGIYFGLLTLLGALLLATIKFRAAKVVFILLVASFVVCLITTYLTGTRTALLSLTTTWLFILALNKQWILAISILFSMIIIIAYGILGNSEYLHHLFTRGGLGSWRPQIWVVGIHTGLENFWIGAGLWSDTNLLAVRGDETQDMPHSHNHYLQLIIWTGIIGLAIYLITLFRAIQLSVLKHQQPFALVACLSLIYFMLVQFFDVYTIFTKPSYYWPCIWVPIGITLGLPSKNAGR